MILDYIIVGSGLAGISFSEIALQHQKNIIVFDDHSHQASLVAGGMYNPVVLKRFTAVWNAKEQLDFAHDFYKSIEQKLNVSFDYKIPVYRKIFSIEEQNNWFVAADKPHLVPFLNPVIQFDQIKNIDAPFGYGCVNGTGFLDTQCLLHTFHRYLEMESKIVYEKFDYSQLQFHDEFISYKTIKAKNIVFADGFGLHQNPYFNDLPLDGTKGELLVIKSSELDLKVIVNTSIFIMPLGADLFKVGATYHWSDKTNIPTEAAKMELIDKLKDILNCSFEIVSHFAGVRPTVKDRRPLVGTHPLHKQLHLLNGLGTRGVMLAPYLAKHLFLHIEKNIELDKEIDIKRFYI